MSINEKKLSKIDQIGGDNIGGVQHTGIYFAAYDWFEDNGIKAPSTHLGATDLADLVTIAVDHVFKTGYGFMKIYGTPKTGNIESPSVGEDDGKISNNIFTFLHPGSAAENLGFQRKFQNKDGIWLVKEACGQVRQLGSECIPARMSLVTNTLGGGTHEGLKGSTYEIMDFQSMPAPIYTGAIYLATESSAS